MYVYIYVCIYVRMYIYMYVCMYVRTCELKSVGPCTCTSKNLQISVEIRNILNFGITKYAHCEDQDEEGK